MIPAGTTENLECTVVVRIPDHSFSAQLHLFVEDRNSLKEIVLFVQGEGKEKAK